MTVQARGRTAVPWPLAGTLPAGGLAAEIYAGVAYIGDNLTTRWSDAQPINAAATFQFDHSFGLSLANLRVRLYESGAELSEAAVTSGFTIAQVSTDILSVTNTGGVSRTIEVYVEPLQRLRKGDLDPEFDAVIEQLSTISHNDTVTGTAATAGVATTSYKRLTAAGTLVSLAGLTAPSPVENRLMILMNSSGASVSILNEDAGATAANRIATGTGATVALADGAALLLVYGTTSSRWRVIGGSGGGGYASSAQVALAAAGTVTGVTSGFNKIRVAGASAAITLAAAPFGSTAALDGTEIVLIGGSNTNTVSLTATDAAKGFVGNGDVELFKGSSLTVIYDASLDRWVEKARNIISIA